MRRERNGNSALRGARQPRNARRADPHSGQPSTLTAGRYSAPDLLAPSDLGDERRHVAASLPAGRPAGIVPVAEARLGEPVAAFCTQPLLIVCRTSVARRLEHVQVRTDLADRVGGGQRVADPAVLAEQLPPALLAGGQLDPADLRVGVGVVAGQDRRAGSRSRTRRTGTANMIPTSRSTPPCPVADAPPARAARRGRTARARGRPRRATNEATPSTRRHLTVPARRRSGRRRHARATRWTRPRCPARTRSSSPAARPRGSPRPRSRLVAATRPLLGQPAPHLLVEHREVLDLGERAGPGRRSSRPDRPAR